MYAPAEYIIMVAMVTIVGILSFLAVATVLIVKEGFDFVFRGSRVR